MSTVAEVPKPAAKVAKAKKVSAPRKRSASAHPSYFEMVKDAIVTLKERTGSSQYAVTKFIEQKQKNLPPNFKRLLLVQLRKLVASGKLTTVKHSYKLSQAAKPKTVAVKSKSVAKPKTVATGKRKAPEKSKAVKKPGKALKTSKKSTPSKVKKLPAPKKAVAAKRTPAKAKTVKKPLAKKVAAKK